jgi:hypothetical protein
MTSETRPLGNLIGSLIGPTVWAGHFFVMYGAEALICTSGDARSMRGFAAVATTLAIGLLAAAIVRDRRRSRRCNERPPALRDISNTLSLISIGAILAVALPAVVMPTCVNPAG